MCWYSFLLAFLTQSLIEKRCWEIERVQFSDIIKICDGKERNMMIASSVDVTQLLRSLSGSLPTSITPFSSTDDGVVIRLEWYSIYLLLSICNCSCLISKTWYYLVIARCNLTLLCVSSSINRHCVLFVICNKQKIDSLCCLYTPHIYERLIEKPFMWSIVLSYLTVVGWCCAYNSITLFSDIPLPSFNHQSSLHRQDQCLRQSVQQMFMIDDRPTVVILISLIWSYHRHRQNEYLNRFAIVYIVVCAKTQIMRFNRVGTHNSGTYRLRS
jgi:hypothetical protein